MDKNKLDSLFSELSVFAEVIKQGNFSGAAKKLGLTPTTVSLHIKRLEDVLQLKLLHQTAPLQGRLTESGKIAVNYYKKELETRKPPTYKKSLTSNNTTTLLRISSSKILADQILRPIFLEFAKIHPSIKLHLKTTDQPLDFTRDNVDILIQINNKTIDSLVNIKVGKTKQILCASPEYIEKNGMPTDPEQLVNLNCLFLNENDADSSWHFIKNAQDSIVQLNKSNVVKHIGVLQHSIEQGEAIGYLPDFIVAEKLENETLIAIMQDWQLQGNLHNDIYLQLLPNKKLPNKSQVFIDFIKNKIS